MTIDTQEKRKHARKTTANILRVFDLNTREYLGNVVNISAGGMLLVTRLDLQVNSLYQFSLENSAGEGDEQPLVFGGEILWTDDSTVGYGKWAGVQIIDISAEMNGRLNALIAKAARTEAANG